MFANFLVFDFFVYLLFAIFAVVLIVLAVRFIVHEKKKDLYHFLKNFKNKSILWIYVFSFFVYLLGAYAVEFYNYTDVTPTIFKIFKFIAKGFELTIEAATLKLRTDELELVFKYNLCYTLLTYLTFIFTTLSSFLFLINFVINDIKNWKRNICARFSKKEKIIIIGFNEINYKMVENNADKKIMIIDCVNANKFENKKDIIRSIKEKMSLLDVRYKIFDTYQQLVKYIYDLNKKKNNLKIICNLEDENTNLKIINQLYNHIDGLNDEVKWKIVKVRTGNGKLVKNFSKNVKIENNKLISEIPGIVTVKGIIYRNGKKVKRQRNNYFDVQVKEMFKPFRVKKGVSIKVNELLGKNSYKWLDESLYEKVTIDNQESKIIVEHENPMYKIELKLNVCFDDKFAEKAAILKQLNDNNENEINLQLDNSIDNLSYKFIVTHENKDNEIVTYNDDENEIQFIGEGNVIVSLFIQADGIIKDYANVETLLKKNKLLSKKVIINAERKTLINKPYELKLFKNKLSMNKLSKIKFYLIGSYENKSLYKTLAEKSKGTLYSINKHKLIADNFECDYPLNNFMNENHIEYDKGLLKKDIDINVFYIGFGRVNKELFINSVCNNQFCIEKTIVRDNTNKNNSDLQSNQNEKKTNINNTNKQTNENEENEINLKFKPVNYYIFEKNEDKKNEQNLNYTFYRFEKEYYNEFIESEYYKKLEKPSNYLFNRFKVDGDEVNLDSKEFYYQMKKIIESNSTQNKNATVNYISVSIGDDINNIGLAKKLEQKINEWNLNCNSIVKIFVRVRDFSLKDMLEKSNNYLYTNMIIPFGSDDEILNISKIINDNLDDLAFRRHMIYARSSTNFLKLEDDLKEIANDNGDIILEEYSIEKLYEAYSIYTWYNKWTQSQRDSNYYAVINLRFKLKMLGIDYNINRKMSVKEFYLLIKNFYEKYNFPTIDKGDIIETYESLFKENSRRNMAVQEHQRWNAFMICNGIIPPTISEINYNIDNPKKYLNPRRKHANITTVDGLKEYMINMGYIASNTGINNEIGQEIYKINKKIEILENKIRENKDSKNSENEITKLKDLKEKKYENIKSNIVSKIYLNQPITENYKKLCYSKDVFKYDFDILDEFIMSIWKLNDFKNYVYISCESQENSDVKKFLQRLDKENVNYIMKPQCVTKEANLKDVFKEIIQKSSCFITIMAESEKFNEEEIKYANYYNKQRILVKFGTELSHPNLINNFEIETYDQNLNDLNCMDDFFRKIKKFKTR